MARDVDLTPEQRAMVRDGSQLVRAAADHHTTGERYRLALLVVELRETFRDAEGRVDYRGASADYRAAVAQMYAGSGLRKAEQQRVRYSVNHHVSNILRDTLTPEQLAEYGLQPVGQNALRAARRARNGE